MIKAALPLLRRSLVPVGVLVPSGRSCPFGGIAEIDEDPPTTDSRNFHSEVHLFVMNSLNVSLVISCVCSYFFLCLDSLL